MKVLRVVEEHARGLASATGCISLGLGVVLTAAPRRGAALVGWESRPRLAWLSGAADLVVGAGLLLYSRRSRWMFLRASLDAAVVAVYALVLAEETPRRGRTLGAMGLMSVLAGLVYVVARGLREVEDA